MKIVKPYARILAPWGLTEQGVDFGLEAMRRIEWCARISHRSEEAQTEDSWKRFINTVVLQHGDWSVVEHVSVSVDVLVDRGITHEFVRHRLFSYTQESTRFVNYEKKMPPSFIYPHVGVECQYCLSGDVPVLDDDAIWWHKVKAYTSNLDVTFECSYDYRWLAAVVHAEESYKALLGEGCRPQEARSVFPNALASRIVATGNLRTWRHFFIMRTTKEAHPQMRQITVPLLADFQRVFPILFDDIVPLSRQVDNLKLPR